MKHLKYHIIILLLLCISLTVKAQHCHNGKATSLPNCEQQCKQKCDSNNVSPSTLIIWYNKKHKKKLLKAVKKYKAEVLYDYKNFNGIAIKIPDGKDINAAITYFQKIKGVLQVNRDQIMHID